MLAILKARAAYLALDPVYPVERLRFMLKDSRCRLVISQGSELTEDLTRDRVHLKLDEVGQSDQGAGYLEKPDHRDLAYVIYTSGSTGVPKGVLLEHRGVVLLADSLAAFYRDYNIRCHYQFFSLTFDASVWEIFFALLNGLELFIDPRGPGALEPDELLELLDEEGVDTLMTTPSYISRATPGRRRSLRTITVCGEPCPLGLARSWAQTLRFVNAYGPTENTVAATMSEIYPDDEEMTIGWPLSHVDVLALNDGRPVPQGEVGELYLAGPAVARGYQRRPDLSRAAFVPDELSSWPEPRMYGTGDLGRLRADGRFEFMGRVDDQLKIRGFRIEPSEVEARLRALDGIVDAVVVPFGDPPSLAAFVSSNHPIDADAVRGELRQRLPHHMVPLIVERIERVPLLASGKADRQALRARAEAAGRGGVGPRVDGNGRDLDASPRTRVEAAWKDVLGRDALSEGDDFFDLGGHSVLANAVIVRLRDELAIELPLRSLFENPTLGQFSDAVQTAAEQVAPAR